MNCFNTKFVTRQCHDTQFITRQCYDTKVTMWLHYNTTFGGDPTITIIS